MDAVQPCPAPANFYRFTPGLWVNFSGPIDSKQLKRRGYIISVEDGHVVVVDERMFGEVSNKISSAGLAYIRLQFEIDTQELEVAASQGPSLPAADLVHPWLGKRVVVVQGPRRGYHGVVRDVGNTSITVELDALFAGTVSPRQQFAWHHLRPAYVYSTTPDALLMST